tara:strand:- start:5642 stop:6481 length:840 start_codon:yes stop_codon:yes gene_type:complete
MISNSTFLAAKKIYRNSDIVLFGCPLDTSTSFRPGTRFGPDSIRSASEGLETYSPILDLELEKIEFCDIGNLQIGQGNSQLAISEIYKKSREIFTDNKIPFALGGEHLITVGLVNAASEFFPDLHVIHLDAHADLRTSYEGTNLSHACVMSNVESKIGIKNISHFGVRSGTSSEWRKMKENKNLFQLDVKTMSNFISGLGDAPIYLTLDLDVLNPSELCGTGCPEPGGISFSELNQIFKHFHRFNVVGLDVVELSPMLDQSDLSSIVAAKVVRELLLTL